MPTRHCRFVLAILIISLSFMFPLVAAAPLVRAETAGQTAAAQTAVNLRAGGSLNHNILLTIPAGAPAAVIGRSGDWLNLTYGGQTGWSLASLFSITANEPTASDTAAGLPAAQGMMKANAYVNLRAGASTGHSILLAIPTGATAELLGRSGDWLNLRYNGNTGWSLGSLFTPANTLAPPPESPPTLPLPSEGTARAKTFVNLRSGAGTAQPLLLTLPTGAEAAIIGAANDWLNLRYNGKTGWSLASLFTVSTSPPAAPEPTPAPANPSETGATIATASTYVNLRSGAGTTHDRILTIPAGAAADVLRTSGDWLNLRYNGQTGWSLASLFRLQNTPAEQTDPPTEPAPAEPGNAADKRTATANAYVNMRQGAAVTNLIVLTIPTGERADVIGESGGWLNLSYNGKQGWSLASLFTLGTAVPAEPTPSPTPEPEPPKVIPDPAYNRAMASMYVNLRTGPSTATSVLLSIPANAVAEYHGKGENGWIQLSFNGKTGWGMASLFKLFKNTDPPPSPFRADAELVWPLAGIYVISSPYGWRNFEGMELHEGVDIPAPTGTPIVAAKEGEVMRASYSWLSGTFVVLKHPDGLMSLYCHMSNRAVAKGDTVTAGQVIGFVGSTGRSTGPHLHFEVRRNGTPDNELGESFNPMPMYY